MSDPEFQHVAARADLCRLLAACYYEPGPEFAEEDLFGGLRRAAVACLPAAVTDVDAMAADYERRALQDLRVDYTALFLNPGGALASPYESVWIGRQDPMLAERSMQAVTAFYAEAGFEISSDFRDLPDHAAAELEFLYTGRFREARARAHGDAIEIVAAAELRRRFVQRHLGRWIADFTEAMRANARTEFYKALGGVTQRLVAAEAD